MGDGVKDKYGNNKTNDGMKIEQLSGNKIKTINTRHMRNRWPPLTKKLSEQIESYLIENIGKSKSGKKKVSPKTNAKRKSVVKNFFIVLFQLGYKIDDVNNLREKHLIAVFNYLENQGQKSTTLVNKISIMRIFCEWIGKRGMIRNPQPYIVIKGPIQTSSKFSSEKTINTTELIANISRIDKFVALELELVLAFGLQVSEAISLKPSNKNRDEVIIIRGGKSHKDRKSIRIPIKNIVQRDVILRADLISDTTRGFLGCRMSKPEQRKSHFYYIMRKCGITLSKEGITVKDLNYQYVKDGFDRLEKMEGK